VGSFGYIIGLNQYQSFIVVQKVGEITILDYQLRRIYQSRRGMQDVKGIEVEESRMPFVISAILTIPLEEVLMLGLSCTLAGHRSLFRFLVEDELRACGIGGIWELKVLIIDIRAIVVHSLLEVGGTLS